MTLHNSNKTLFTIVSKLKRDNSWTSDEAMNYIDDLLLISGLNIYELLEILKTQ